MMRSQVEKGPEPASPEKEKLRKGAKTALKALGMLGWMGGNLAGIYYGYPLEGAAAGLGALLGSGVLYRALGKVERMEGRTEGIGRESGVGKSSPLAVPAAGLFGLMALGLLMLTIKLPFKLVAELPLKQMKMWPEKKGEKGK